MTATGVVEEGFEGSFSQYNLYENRFGRVLGLIAFTGYGSSVRTSLASCPEFTTNGMLPKAIPHKACAEDALSDFSSDCIEIPQAY